MTVLKRQFAMLISIGLIFGSTLGCSSEVDPLEALKKANDTNVKRLTSLYFAYQTKNNWKGPKNEKAFKEFVKNFNPKKLSRIGIDPDASDAIFVSERDGEPLKFRPSVPGSPKGSSEPVVFETTGVDGKRMVGFLNMEVREVDEAEYNQLWSGK